VSPAVERSPTPTTKHPRPAPALPRAGGGTHLPALKNKNRHRHRQNKSQKIAGVQSEIKSQYGGFVLAGGGVSEIEAAADKFIMDHVSPVQRVLLFRSRRWRLGKSRWKAGRGLPGGATQGGGGGHTCTQKDMIDCSRRPCGPCFCDGLALQV
jgi:hypothetical protein